MKCDWVILCDQAGRRNNGRTFIDGIFDTFILPLPGITHPPVTVVARFVGDPGETATIGAELCAPGGNAIAAAKGSAKLGNTGTVEARFELPGFPIESTGLYGVRVSINSEVKGMTTLVVREL